MNIIDSVLTCDEDRKFYSERGFRIDKAVLYEKTKELDIFSTSDMELTTEDISFLKNKFSDYFPAYTISIDNFSRNLNELEDEDYDLAMIDETINNTSEGEYEDFKAKIENEDASYVDNHQKIMENLKKESKDKKSNDKPQKKTYYKPKTNKFGEVIKIKELAEEDTFPTIEGEVFSISKTDTRTEGLKIAKFFVYDGTESLCVKCFLRDEQNDEFDNSVKNGTRLRLNGEYKYDKFDHQMAIIMRNYEVLPKPLKIDESVNKRVEIHAHTKMSLLEGSIEPEDLVGIYKQMGHRGIFITDNACVQAYPNVMDMGDETFKIGYGMEANFFDDTEKYVQDYSENNGDYVVFDIETTGLNPYECELIEIGAVKVRDGEIIERYNQLIKPKSPIPTVISNLTSIDDELVKNEPYFEDIKDDFLAFIDGCVLVAHNANFDVGFIKQKFLKFGIEIKNPFADTMKMARDLVEGVRNYKLDTLTDKLNIRLVSHHRAVDDAEATAHLFINMMTMLKTSGKIESYSDLYKVSYEDRRTSYRMLLYAKNYIGLKNLYLIITKSCTENFNKVPRVSLSDLMEHREGLIIGAEAVKGEIFSYYSDGFLYSDIKSRLEKYDFCEVQPTDHYAGLIGAKYPQISNISNVLGGYFEFLSNANMKMIAGGNVYEKTPEDVIYRKILGKSRGDFRADSAPPLYIKTTQEIMDGLDYIPYDKKEEIVVTNSNWLLDEVETMRAIPREKFPPIIEGSEDELRNTCIGNAKKIYGDPLPEIVDKRLEKELHSIIGNGYSVMYIIAKKLVNKSNSDGYLVGSRGSVGSSFAATMSDITEVNPLPPHYVCKKCKYSKFFTNGEYNVGIDMPDEVCPVCGEPLKKDGFNIPFETFLGFNGDKEPDIDLNFAGEYQSVAHKFVEELFGEGYVFRAGTLAKIQDKVGYGYVKNYFEEHGEVVSEAEINRLINGIVGIKRTTGQHPGGIMIVPKNKDIHDFSPIQYPADDASTGVFTTHFAYKALHSNILKLDILGHDGPTMIRMLEDLTGVKSDSIKLDDPEILKMFVSTEPLGLTKEELGSEVSTFGIPEFGTDFVRNMLVETQPQLFSDLIRISGLSHGTDVWTNNAQILVREGTCKIADVIATREDIMTYLLNAGLPNDFSFFTMEKVRKGKPLTPEDEEKMRAHNLPEWYIDSCNKIKYMFPKAHAVAYVMLSFRLAWYKLHYPREFYATFLSTKKDNFEMEIISSGLDAINDRMNELKSLPKNTKKEEEILKVYDIAREMYLRGFKCDNVDLYKSESARFAVSEDGILPPLSTIPSLGESVSENIVKEREIKRFISVEDLQKRTKLNNTCVRFMEEHNLLGGLQETNQMSMF